MGSKRSYHGQGKVQLPAEMLGDAGSRREGAQVREDQEPWGALRGSERKLGQKGDGQRWVVEGGGEQSRAENPRSPGGVPGGAKKPT